MAYIRFYWIRAIVFLMIICILGFIYLLDSMPSLGNIGVSYIINLYFLFLNGAKNKNIKTKTVR